MPAFSQIKIKCSFIRNYFKIYKHWWGPKYLNKNDSKDNPKFCKVNILLIINFNFLIFKRNV